MFSLLVTFNLSALTTPSTVTLSVTFTSLNEPLAVAVILWTLVILLLFKLSVSFTIKGEPPGACITEPDIRTLPIVACAEVRNSVAFTFKNEPLAVAVTLPVTPKVEPSNVRLAESSISPPPPTITTLSFVKSVTVRDAILASSDIFKSANEADAEPLRFDVISCVPVTLSIEPSNVKFADESTPCVPVNVVIWLFVPLPLMIESPFDNNILCSTSFAPAIQ